MTHQEEMEQRVDVLQCDRDAAWPFRPVCYKDTVPDRQNWDAGVYDKLPVIVAFARHRQAFALSERNDGWRDIETAPRDGTDVLLFYPLEGLRHDWNPQVVIGSWRDRGYWVWQNRAVAGYSSEYQPTHWRPLPEPPATTIRSNQDAE